MRHEFFQDTNFSKICFGCEPLGGTDWGNIDLDKIEVAINLSIEKGLNFFDTADCYGLGLSEERLSQILGSKRKDLVIATKGGMAWKKKPKFKRAKMYIDCSRKHLENAFVASLKRLRLDYIPVYYVHNADLNVSFEETFSFLNDLQNNKKIGLIGCSNFSFSQIKTASKYCKLSLIQSSVNIIDGLPDKKILNFCKENDTRIVAYNVLYSGFLSGKFTKQTYFEKNDRRHRQKEFIGSNLNKLIDNIEMLKQKASNLNISLTHYAIQEVLKNENILSIITGIKNKDQLTDNLNSLI
jgi:aryl-alcohol dehydrogenase-like predicted oxidoreductase